MRRAVLSLMCLSGCAYEGQESDLAQTHQAVARTQGGQVQGGQVQGGQVQGGQVQGGGVVVPNDAGVGVISGTPITTHIERISSSVTFRGSKAKAGVVGGALRVVSSDGVAHAGTELVGTTLRGFAPAGVTVPTGQYAEYELRIDEAFVDPVTTLNMIDSVWPASLRSNSDIWLYRISQRPAGSTDSKAWVQLCSTKSGKLGEASDSRASMFFAGYWQQSNRYTWVDDGSSFTFGCHDAVAAKCARWGYKPWVSLSSATYIDFKQLHRACVRAATADYCGEGVAYTVNGTAVDVYDNYGLAPKVPGSVQPGYADESTFSPAGAECVERYRWDTTQRCAYTQLIKAGMDPLEVAKLPVDGCAAGDVTCSLYRDKPQSQTVNLYQEGSLSTCLRSLLPTSLIKIASGTYCTHSTSTVGIALGKSCNDTTTCVCGRKPECCDRATGWTQACVDQASMCVAASGSGAVVSP